MPSIWPKIQVPRSEPESHGVLSTVSSSRVDWQSRSHSAHLSGNGNLDLNTGLDVDDDLFDDLGRGIQVDETLVDSLE